MTDRTQPGSSPAPARAKRRTWQRLGIAAAVSGALHAAVIVLGHIELPHNPQDWPPLAVRIVPAAPAPHIPSERVRVHARTAPAPKVVAATRREAPVSPSAAPQEADSQEAPAAEEMAEAEAPAAEPVVVATAPSSPPDAPTRTLPDFPRTGRITYNIVYGPDRVPVGRTIQSWKIEGERYQLSSRSETTGLIDLIRSQHRTYMSRGALTHEGLRPETFLMSRNRGRGLEEARAQFDWTRGNVTLGGASDTHVESLPQGSQDIVSLLYQLAIDPPGPGRNEVSVTNGRHIEKHVLEVLPEEKIETPLGMLRALPIRQLRKPGSEGVDVWLATEYRYLPVRLRFYSRSGEPSGEQIVTEIRLSDD